MLCLRCGHVNPPRTKHCARCSAMLPRMDFDEGPTSTLVVEDGRDYVLPQRSFPTRYMYDLTCRAYEYIHLEAPGEPLLEAYEVVRSAIERFEAEDMPKLLERMGDEKRKEPDDDFWTQVPYLLNRGSTMLHEGFALMDEFIGTGDVETLKAAVERMQEGNDNFGLARELGLERNRPKKG